MVTRAHMVSLLQAVRALGAGKGQLAEAEAELQGAGSPRHALEAALLLWTAAEVLADRCHSDTEVGGRGTGREAVRPRS